MPATFEIVTVPELAAHLSVTPKTIYLWIKQRDLPPRVTAPGQPGGYWTKACIDGWLEARGISEVSAIVAERKGCSPCARIDRIDDAALAQRWGVEVSTIRRLASNPPFPNVLERKASSIPDEPESLVFNLDTVMSLEKANGNHSGLSKLVQQDELDWDLDKRDDDAVWTQDVQGDIA